MKIRFKKWCFEISKSCLPMIIFFQTTKNDICPMPSAPEVFPISICTAWIVYDVWLTEKWMKCGIISLKVRQSKERMFLVKVKIKCSYSTFFMIQFTSLEGQRAILLLPRGSLRTQFHFHQLEMVVFFWYGGVFLKWRCFSLPLEFLIRFCKITFLKQTYTLTILKIKSCGYVGN